MAFELCAFKLFKRFKPHLLMFLLQICATLLYFMTEASFNQGLNPHVYVTYRHVVASLVVFPFAYFLERKMRPKLTIALFVEFFLLSLVGVSSTLNLYFASMRYTSPAFITAVLNTISPITFIIAVILRLEMVDVRSARGVAKILGTTISLVGVLIIALYKGPALSNLKGAPIHIGTNPVHEEWLKGAILTVSSCLLWSLSYIRQAYTLQKYPAQLSLTAWMNSLGAAQSAAYTVIVQHNVAAWSTTSSIDLWTIIYAGAVCSGLAIYIQLWCTGQKGPVFVTIFNPLATVMVAIVAHFVVGEKLYTGSILGGIIIIIGLYSLLWGKDRDQDCIKHKNQEQSFLTDHKQKEPKNNQTLSSAETQIP